MEDRKVIGLLVVAIGFALIAPRETCIVLDALYKPSKQVKTKPTEQHIGLIRICKKNMVTIYLFTQNKYVKIQVK